MTPGSTLGLGIGMLWFSLLVLIPLAAIVVEASGGGLETYKETFSNNQTFSALKLTVGISFVTTALNMVMGTVIAWVLVRDRFWGKAILDLVIDIPFAMPTIVAGLVLLALYGSQGPLGTSFENTQKAVFLAIAFVTLPFIVRTVQPVLEEMETEVEDAAASLGANRFTIFRRITLPLIAPGITAGALLCFTRSLGEFGATITFAGSFPGVTQTLPIATYLELQRDPDAAIALSLILMIVSVAVLVSLRDRWVPGVIR